VRACERARARVKRVGLRLSIIPTHFTTNNGGKIRTPQWPIILATLLLPSGA